MSPIQQMLLGAGGAGADPTYIDDIFSTFLYTGNDTYPKNIVNGIDLAGEGGAVFGKPRTGAYNWTVHSTEQGVQKGLAFNGTGAQYDNTGNQGGSTTRDLTNFNNNGFTLGSAWSASGINPSDIDVSTFTLRKCAGFFDVVTYTGNGSNRTIAHSLKSLPGCMIIKCMSEARDWAVYHWDLNSYSPNSFNPNEVYLTLNSTSGASSSASVWHLQPTDTHFSVGTNDLTNKNGETYVAYIFAGGESTAATARAVDFDGGDDQLNISDNTDFELGNGDFTLETWIKSTQTTDSYKTAVAKWVDSGSNRSWMIRYSSIDIGTGWSFFYSLDGWNYSGSNGGTLMGSDISDGQWHHIAVTRTGGKIRTFTDGVLNTTVSETGTFYDGSGAVTIGGQSGNYFDGRLSNVRLVKGTALYTSSFRPPIEPLTNVTNTKLLCCNNSSVTGSTVTPGTITATGDPITETNNHPFPSPFSDPAGFKFGESKSEPVIKCGTYIGNGTGWQPGDNPPNLGLFVECGFEPQWVMLKRTSPTGASWKLVNCMTGMGSNVNGETLAPNTNNAGEDEIRIWAESTGFRLGTSSSQWNYDGGYYAFVAIRRSDGYVGKPPDLGTGVFSLGTRSGSSSNALAAVNTLVDFSLIKNYGAGEYWAANARLTGNYSLKTNTINAQLQGALPTSGGVWDRMLGHLVAGSNGATNSPTGNMVDYGWKRYAGMDVVTYTGNGVQGRDIPHSLGVAPNMMWVKNRTRTAGGGAYWNVYVSGITHLSVYGSDPDNRGNNPVSLKLNDTDAAQFSGSGNWDHTHPTSTHFRVGDTYTTNQNGESMIAMLFSSISGISKVGSYTGNGTSGSSTQTITTGFQPRFVIIKRLDTSNSYTGWLVLDTTRGWNNSAEDKRLWLNDDDAQGSYQYGEPTSTGFILAEDHTATNSNNGKYIYYAHA